MFASVVLTTEGLGVASSLRMRNMPLSPLPILVLEIIADIYKTLDSEFLGTFLKNAIFNNAIFFSDKIY